MPPAPADACQFLTGQLFQTPALPPAGSFNGQTVIITGGNTGLGYECGKQVWVPPAANAEASLQLGASTLILACRSPQKGDAARANLLQAHPKVDIQVWQVDMANYASVKAFAARLPNLPRIDALLLNAGIATKKFVSVENSESTLVTNVISTFLLAELALPHLQLSAVTNGRPARLVIIGSAVHAGADPKELVNPAPGTLFASLGSEKTANMENRYYLSKLIVQMGVVKLAQTVDPAQVIINCPGPGWCKTQLEVENGASLGLRIIGREPHIGARCLTAAAAAGPESHGQYMSEGKVKNMSTWLRSKTGQETEQRVWKELKQELHSIAPEEIAAA